MSAIQTICDDVSILRFRCVLTRNIVEGEIILTNI